MDVIAAILILSSSCNWLSSSASHEGNPIVLRASAYEAPPLMRVETAADGTMTAEGVAAENLRMLAALFNVDRIQYIHINHSSGTRESFIDSIIDQLVNRVDIAPFYLPVTSLGLSKTIDFLLSSTYIFTDAIMVAIPKPEKSKPTAFFNPFEHEVWLVLLPLIFIFNAVKTLLSRCDDPIGPRDGGSRRRTDGWRLVRFRFVLVGPWVLMTAILTLSYTATLQSHLTVTKLKPIPNTVEELAKNLATRPLLAVRDMSLSHRILEAESGPLRQLGIYLQKHPQNILNDLSPSKILQHVLNGGAFIGSQLIIEWIIQHDIDQTGGKCRFMVSREISTSKRISFGLPRNHPHTDTLNMKQLTLVSHGFNYNYFVNFSSQVGKCRNPVTTSVGRRTLELEDLMGSFYILIIGTFLSFLCFLWERLRTNPSA